MGRNWVKRNGDIDSLYFFRFSNPVLYEVIQVKTRNRYLLKLLRRNLPIFNRLNNRVFRDISKQLVGLPFTRAGFFFLTKIQH